MYSTLLQSQSSVNVKALWQSEPFIVGNMPNQNLTRWEVLQAAEQLSQHNLGLSNSTPLSATVLFQQRHHFLISCLAVALKKGHTILPPNLAQNTLSQLNKAQCNLWVFDDETPQGLKEQNQVQSRQIDYIIDQVKSQPLDFDEQDLESLFSSIKDSEIWLYTSGTTGAPKKIIKTWQNLIHSAQIAINRFQLMQPNYIVATVPNQHMFGLETAIFWPLFSQSSLWFERPLFPEDIRDALQANSNFPALLVSTPLHLNKLQAFDLKWPTHLTRVLSATAPLSKSLAEQVEKQMDVQVFEIYGSTETASIASKQTTVSDQWFCYQNVELQPQHNQNYAVKTPGLNQFELLNDQIELIDPRHFKLGKRNSDLIKIAGKRASLAELNHRLQSIEGLTEGVFIPSKTSERLIAFVVSDLSSPDIIKALRKSIDPVFLPRPIIFLKTLPRNEVGKVLYNELQSNLTHE